MKPFFPISKISKISPNMLIQPFFIDQKIKDKKPIKGLGKIIVGHQKK